MLMIGYFSTGKTPFEHVFLHGLVRDSKGQKMSKSKGNVVNPMDMVTKYGADALRLSLIFGVGEGNDLPFSEQKVVGMRNFCNKIWNMGRFIYMNRNQKSKVKSQKPKVLDDLKKEFEAEKKNYFKAMNSFKFSQALGDSYEFIWHRLADFYIEQLKDVIINGNIEALEALENVYLENLKMLHPFAPFVTEAVWKTFNGEESSILLEKLTG